MNFFITNRKIRLLKSSLNTVLKMTINLNQAKT